MPDFKLLDRRAHDGSRIFAELPQSLLWQTGRDHALRLDGARIGEFITDGVTEAWIDFTYAGHAFTINDQFGEYRFFVKDPACGDAVLSAVVAHFVELLGPPRTQA
jgi:hypothetical protein